VAQPRELVDVAQTVEQGPRLAQERAVEVEGVQRMARLGDDPFSARCSAS
jgi:hypothetical protein